MPKPLNAFFFRDFKNSYIPDILDEIYVHKIYEPFLIGKTDLLIADLGGNVGLTSYYFKDYAREVFIIEPAKEHQETIKTMLEYNEIKNVTLCPYAITNTNGKTKFFHYANTTAFSLTQLTDGKDFEEVETWTFDKFMATNKLEHLDLLKLDPEGEEAKILTSEGFRKYAPKIKVIVGEWHSWCNMEKNQFANVLIDLGYTFRWLPNMKASCYTAVRI